MREKSIAGLLLLVLLSSCMAEHKVSVRSPFANPTTDTKLTAEALRVPRLLSKIFAQAYPGAQQVCWRNELDDFTVNFVHQGQAYELCYDEQAHLLDQKIFVAIDQLKPQINQLIAKNHPKQKALKAYHPKGENPNLLVVLLDDQSEAYYRISLPISQEIAAFK